LSAERLGNQRPAPAGPLHWPVGPWSLTLKQLLNGEADVASDLPKQGGRDVTARVKGHRRTPAVSVPVLPMRSTLPNLLKPEALQENHYFTGLQNRDGAHVYATRMV